MEKRIKLLMNGMGAATRMQQKATIRAVVRTGLLVYPPKYVVRLPPKTIPMTGPVTLMMA